MLPQKYALSSMIKDNKDDFAQICLFEINILSVNQIYASG